MWHEARKQEKKVRSHMVDAVKRNERRKQYYESIRRDPEQFMQVHGRKCHVNLDPAVAQAAESSSTLRKWQGNPDILIDRFDARSHLDYIPEVKQEDEDSWDTLGMHEEETPCDYERYRVLVANDYKKISEKQWLKDIATKEFWGETKNKQNQKAKMEVQRKRQLAEKKAAIGFSYEGSETVVGTSHLPHYSGESDNEGLDEIGFDLKLDVRRMSAEELSALNKIGQQYRVGGTTFIKLVKLDQKEQDETAQIKEIDKAKLALSGRGAKADRAMLKKRRAEIVGKVSQNEEATTTLLSFIAKKNDKKLRLESSSSSEDERVHHERTEFIRSFGGERLDKSGDDSPTRDVVQGPVLPSQEYRKILALKSRRSPSPFSFHEQSTSRKVASSPVRRNRRLRSQSPISPPCNDRTTVAVSDSTTEDAGDDQPLEIRSSMSESEKERVEIENRKRMYRRTKRMARKREKAKDSDSDNERKVFAARKLRQQMQRALTKTATELKAEEEERMRELKERRRKRDDDVQEEAKRLRGRNSRRSESRSSSSSSSRRSRSSRRRRSSSRSPVLSQRRRSSSRDRRRRRSSSRDRRRRRSSSSESARSRCRSPRRLRERRSPSRPDARRSRPKRRTERRRSRSRSYSSSSSSRDRRYRKRRSRS